MSEDKFIVGRIRLNPIENEFIPCIEIIADTLEGMVEGNLLLLEVLTEGKSDWGVNQKIKSLEEEIKEFKKKRGKK